MKSSIIFLTSIFLTANGSLFQRQAATTPATQDYLNSVCSPNITITPGAVIPPCVSVVNIETQCRPNGTTPLDYLAHAECMCSPPSTYFADWIACRQCLYLHGGLTQLALNQFSAIISAASNSLCTGTPTAVFQSIFPSVQSAGASVTSGSTVFSDQFPSQTAVSLYYTASGKQGTGAITGSAAAATAQGPKTTSLSSGSKGSTSAGVTPGTTGATTTTSKGNAKATKAAYLPGVAMAIVGGIAVAIV